VRVQADVVADADGRRIVPTRCSSVPPACWSTIGTRPKPIASSSGSSASASSAASRGAAGSSPWGAAAAAAAVAARSALLGCLRSDQPTAKNRPPMIRKGIFGSAGTSAKHMITTPATSGALRCSMIWPAMSLPRSSSDAERVTRMPVATEISSAGIWAHRPSPTVSSEKVWAASPNGMPCCMTPMTMPPMRLMPVIRIPAIASPLTNFEAPSMAP
jgi:hypothetical protein